MPDIERNVTPADVIEVPQPWAGGIVLGGLDVIPMPRKPKVPPSGSYVAIAAVGTDTNGMRHANLRRFLQRHGADGLRDEDNKLLGYARVHHVAKAGECDLFFAFARGQWAVVLDSSTRWVLVTPRPYDPVTWRDGLDGATLTTPDIWHRAMAAVAQREVARSNPELMKD